MNPPVSPKLDVAYVGVTTSPPSIHSKSSSGHKHQSKSDIDYNRDPPPVPPRFMSLNPQSRPELEWEAKEELWRQEMDEVKLRAAQMEKTMRWWSDCTANWREKWSKVRNERNKAREEVRILRSKLESAVKELASLKNKNADLKSLVSDNSSNGDKSLSRSSETKKHLESINCVKTLDSGAKHSNETKSITKNRLSQEYFDDELSLKDIDSIQDHNSDSSVAIKDCDTNSNHSSDSKTVSLLAKIDELQSNVNMHIEEKQKYVKQINSMEYEMTVFKAKYQDMIKSKEVLQVEKESKILNNMSDENNIEDDISVDKKLEDLRKELVRMQAENAQEWGRREHLESEKISLERENKKLLSEINNLEEELTRKSRQASAVMDGDIRNLQTDLAERTKELSELKHSNNKMKKLLQEKCTDLEHATRRSEQYELEVKKLRGRIEDLKQDLASAEDEVDQQSNQVRRLQRSNDEYHQQIEVLQVQVDHLQTRLKRSSQNIVVKNAHDTHESNNEEPSEDEDP